MARFYRITGDQITILERQTPFIPSRNPNADVDIGD
jgi:hypothetical protein